VYFCSRVIYDILDKNDFECRNFMTALRWWVDWNIPLQWESLQIERWWRSRNVEWSSIVDQSVTTNKHTCCQSSSRTTSLVASSLSPIIHSYQLAYSRACSDRVVSHNATVSLATGHQWLYRPVTLSLSLSPPSLRLYVSCLSVSVAVVRQGRCIVTRITCITWWHHRHHHAECGNSLVRSRRPISPQICPLLWGIPRTPFLGPTRPTTPNVRSIDRFSRFCTMYTVVTNGQTDRLTKQQSAYAISDWVIFISPRGGTTS